MPKKSLIEQHHALIKEHILDPVHSPLPPQLRPQLDRVLQAARLLDDYPATAQICTLLQRKYAVSKAQVMRDIDLAREIYKTQHTFDWDFWFAWMLKDQAELIRRAKESGNLKEWNKAKLILFKMIGEKPATPEDPRRMEKNVFYIQMNYDGRVINVPREALRKLTEEDLRTISESCVEEIDPQQAAEYIES